MTDLRTDYKDDVLDTTVNTQRKYQMTNNEDGTVSFTDVTQYTQVGDSFGALDVNAMNGAIAENAGAIEELNGELKAGAFKEVLNNVTKGALGYVANTAQNLIPTIATIAFWDGAHSGTNSNLAYCNKGAFGAAAVKNVDTTPTASSANLITSGGVKTALNNMQTKIDNCFQSASDGKKTVASAITGMGVSTAADATYATMAANIKKISKGKCIYLGTGTSFNVQTVCANNGLDYTKLTNSNFIVGASGGAATSITNTSASGYYNNPVAAVGGFTVSYSYNASTGVLTVAGNGQTVTAYLTGNNTTKSTAQGITLFAYLVYVG